MTSVDFYILHSSEPRARLLIGCRLTEKAWHNGYKTFILTESPEQLKAIDDLLWTFRAGSFIPHACDEGLIGSEVPVGLGPKLDPEFEPNLLINLQSAPLDPPETVDRIIEIVDQDERVREEGRRRYRHYQKVGKTVRSHRI